MSFFKEEKLYRIEIIKKCPIMDVAQCIFSKGYLPFNGAFKKDNFGFIPTGTKGWVVTKHNKKYFLPDENQAGLDLFMPADQNSILIALDKIKDAYKVL